MRPFSQSETKRIQSWIDKGYRYIWSNIKEEPLRQMERNHMTMQDVRNELDMMIIKSKIEKNHLIRFGDIARMSDERLAKTDDDGLAQKTGDGEKTKEKKDDDACILAQTIEGRKYRNPLRRKKNYG